MKKEAWSILSAVIAILLVCLAMAFTSGCDKETPLEVGQVDEVNDSIRLVEWPDPPTDMSFCFNDTEVIFAWDGEKFDVIYDANDLTGAANVFFGCMKSYLNAHIEAAAERLNRKGQPGPDKCQDCVALKTILKDSIANTDRAMEAAKSLVMQIDALTGLNETQAEPNGPPQWGKGDLSPEYIKFFGNSNGSRLDFMQNQTIDRHSEIIKEMAIRILILEGADPNDVRLGGVNG